MRILLVVTGIVLVAFLIMQQLFKEEEDIHGDIQVTAADILKDNKDADFFQFNNVIYINVESSPHINTKNFHKGKQIGEIIDQSNDAKQISDGIATKLPPGTIIYQTIGKGLSILSIEIDDEIMIYMALLNDVFLNGS